MKGLVELAKPVVERFPALAAFYRSVRDGLPITEQPRETPFGFKLAGNPAMTNGSFEPEETQLIQRILERAGIEVFINIGANIGYYCCIARSAGVPVIAFEPIERNLRYLLRNVRANGWKDGLEVFPVALSDAPGTVEIYGGGTGASLVRGWASMPEHYVRVVPTSTLDLVIGQRLHERRSLILVDIEGAERRMLEGAQRVLRNTPKPIWLVEVSSTEHQPKGQRVNPNLLSTFDVFWNLGYEATTADATRRRVDRDEVSAVAGGGPNTLGTHNFLFASPDDQALLGVGATRSAVAR